MSQLRSVKMGPGVYFVSAVVLALLPLFPETYLLFRNHEDLKYFGPIAYYELIVSFLLLFPAFLLGGRFSRIWIVLVGAAMAVATVVVGFQSVSIGARWDLTAHAALLQTSVGESLGFARSFLSPSTAAWIALLLLGFSWAITANGKSQLPSRRWRFAALALGLIASSYGIHNTWRYGRQVFEKVQISTGESLKIVGVGINRLHPVTLLLATHHNYEVTHAYYIETFKRVAEHIDQFKGGVTADGAVAPRNVVVVIGESASRRHWSLYGYARETNPEMRRLASEITLFRDVISSSVGTQTVLRAMFTSKIDSIPFFPVLSQAGYRTHWISAQYNQGANDVEIAALVQSCDQRIFLNGSYDEALVPIVKAILESPGRHVIFVNLFGSHVRYDDRYPSSYAEFRGDGEKGHRLAAYDNSILYTDHVLGMMIRTLRARNEAACLLYSSDHAEDVYDSNPDLYLFRSDAVATNAMYEVPFFVWFSDAYAEGNREFVIQARAAANRPYQTLGLYQSIIDLARLRHPMFDPKLSLFSPDFVDRRRRVGVMGRIYQKQGW